MSECEWMGWHYWKYVSDCYAVVNALNTFICTNDLNEAHVVFPSDLWSGTRNWYCIFNAQHWASRLRFLLHSPAQVNCWLASCALQQNSFIGAQYDLSFCELCIMNSCRFAGIIITVIITVKARAHTTSEKPHPTMAADAHTFPSPQSSFVRVSESGE